MADLKHCAQMADSKCHHPIEFLYPEYANDKYAIQRDARSIGFFFLGSRENNFLEPNKFFPWPYEKDMFV